jgi:hypothetical protein
MKLVLLTIGCASSCFMVLRADGIIDAWAGTSWARARARYGTLSAQLAIGRLTDGSRCSFGHRLVDGVRWWAGELRPRETRLSQDPSPLRESGLAEEHHAECVIA